MSKSLRTIFAVHAVVSLVLGALLLLIPGRFLPWLGWRPIDPVITRLLGAALLALGWGSFRGSRAAERRQVALLIELEAAFCVLACVGLLRHMLFGAYPWYAWTTLGLFAAFGIAWIWAFLRK